MWPVSLLPPRSPYLSLFRPATISGLRIRASTSERAISFAQRSRIAPDPRSISGAIRRCASFLRQVGLQYQIRGSESNGREKGDW